MSVMNDSEVQSLIQKIRSVIPDAENQADRSDTVGAVRRLVDGRERSLEKKDIEFLDRLTRKLDIAKRVCVAYDAEWKKPTDKTPVSSAVLLGISLCLIRFGNITGGESREQSLKWMNAALNAVDLAKASEQADPELIKRTSMFLHSHLDVLLAQ